VINQTMILALFQDDKDNGEGLQDYLSRKVYDLLAGISMPCSTLYPTTVSRAA